MGSDSEEAGAVNNLIEPYWPTLNGRWDIIVFRCFRNSRSRSMI